MMDRITGGTDDGRDVMIGLEPIGRISRPVEIALAVHWLCSDPDGFPIGHAQTPDGGLSLLAPCLSA
jgi:NAD(P)-dependent dehydrogenase (short-subunit alcohol dehydrogenase family)